MLPIEKQEIQDFDEILNYAKGKIENMYPEWVNYNAADSGITLLELFVYMNEMQQFHAQQIGPAHIMAFLHLLGVSPGGFVPAVMYTEIMKKDKNDFFLKGTKALAGSVVFEAGETIYMEPEDLLAKEHKKMFYPFGERPEILSYYDIFLNHEMKREITHTLYFDLFDEYAVTRNPIDKDCFIPLVKLQLEYYDGDSFRPCQMLEDTTFGLLQTGVIKFCIEGYMEKIKDSYCLRLVAQGEYDTAPLLKGIYCNMVPMTQRDTRIEYKEFVLLQEGMNFYEVTLDTFYGVYGVTRIYKKEKEGYSQVVNYSDYIYGEKRHFVFARETVEGETGQITLCVVSAKEEKDFQQLSYMGDGSTNQQFYLPDKTVLGAAFSLWVEETKGYFTKWHPVKDFMMAESGQRCYILQETEGILQFGNGKFGKCPKGRIEVIGYALCAGGSGNIQKGQKLMTGTGEILYNEESACGGRQPEDIDDCIKSLKMHLENHGRAVTNGDYEKIIKETPGLRIRSAKVFASDTQENCLEAVFMPYSNGDRILRGDAYNKNIMRHLENKRLLGTKIQINKPEYIGILLHLEIMVKRQYPGAQEKIEGSIRKYFEENMDFGKTIVYSRLYAYIEALPEAVKICELTLRSKGRGVTRAENNDIVIPFQGIGYLKELKTRCILTGEK